MRIGLAGYFNQGNLGDEWFLRAWRETFLGVAEVRVLHPCDALDDLDGVIIGGGDLLCDPPTPYYWRDEMLDRPVWVYGVGAPAAFVAEETREFYRGFLQRCRGVWTRDAGTQSWLAELGVRAEVVEDIAWSTPLPRWRSTRTQAPTIGVSVRPGVRHALEPGLSALAALVGELWPGWHPLLIPLQCPAPDGLSDHPLHVELQQKVNAWCGGAVCDIAPPDLDLEHRLALIGECSAYVTMRFHGLIAGLRYGVPTVALCGPGSLKFDRLQDAVADPVCVTRLHALSAWLDSPRGCCRKEVAGREAASRAALDGFRRQVIHTLYGGD